MHSLGISSCDVPGKCRKQLLAELHEGHFAGYYKVESKDSIMHLVARCCPSCQENCNAPPEAPIHPWPWPSRPWSRLHIDFACLLKNNTMSLVIINTFLKWIEVFPMATVTSFATISKLNDICIVWITMQIQLCLTMVHH